MVYTGCTLYGYYGFCYGFFNRINIMNSVYIVRSGQYDGNIGMTIWINVRVFTSYEVAEAWVESEKLRDKTFNKNFDFYEIEEMTVYE